MVEKRAGMRGKGGRRSKTSLLREGGRRTGDGGKERVRTVVCSSYSSPRPRTAMREEEKMRQGKEVVVAKEEGKPVFARSLAIALLSGQIALLRSIDRKFSCGAPADDVIIVWRVGSLPLSQSF